MLTGKPGKAHLPDCGPPNSGGPDRSDRRGGRHSALWEKSGGPRRCHAHIGESSTDWNAMLNRRQFLMAGPPASGCHILEHSAMGMMGRLEIVP